MAPASCAPSGPAATPTSARLAGAVANVVDVTLQDTYQRFEGKDQAARKDYLQEISRGVAASLSTGSPTLFEGLTGCARDGRLPFWSPNPVVQAELAEPRRPVVAAGRSAAGRTAHGRRRERQQARLLPRPDDVLQPELR